MDTVPIIKSYGTFLNNDKYKYTNFKSVDTATPISTKIVTKILPEQFNPIDQWGNLLTSIQNQGECNCCWATSTVSALTDRLCILTLAQFFEGLSPYEMIMCQGAIIINDLNRESAEMIKKINEEAHSQGACNGNSLYNAMDFLYTFGVTTNRCVNEGEFAKHGFKKLTEINPSEVPLCQVAVGPQYDTCLDETSAARFYRICTGYIVNPTVESIKQEIYKWGPVVGAFQIFDDFIHNYDGKSIYMGPSEGSISTSTSIGHSVKIMGWGKEEVDGQMVDFWWIANSWGTNWGLSGYFKMKMNIPECQLEKNVVAFVPDIEGMDTSYLLYEVKPNPILDAIREKFRVDRRTGYREIAVDKIKRGLLRGNLNDPICRFIPDFKNMWAGEISRQDVASNYLRIAHFSEPRDAVSIWYFIFACVAFFLIGMTIRRRFVTRA